MATFKKTSKVLIANYIDDVIEDEEFILLYDSNFSKNPEFPYHKYGRFNLEKLDSTECEAELRFRKRTYPSLLKRLEYRRVSTALKGLRQMVSKDYALF